MKNFRLSFTFESLINRNNSLIKSGAKWVRIGLVVGLLLILFFKSAKSEQVHSMASPLVQAHAIGAPYLSSTAPLVTQVWQPSQVKNTLNGSAAESVNILGQLVFFSNPGGYCSPGTSAREMNLMSLAKTAIGENSRFLHAAILCSELEDYKIGRRATIDHWLQIQLIGSKGVFQRIEVPRESFLYGYSQASPRVEFVEINRQLRASLEKNNINMEGIQFESIGRDGNAVYFSIKMKMIVRGDSRIISGVGGITLLNSLPISVNVYEGDGLPQSRAKLQFVLQEVLNSLLVQN